MARQSDEEIIRVADEWFRNFCPSNLVKDGPEGTKNAEAIMERCIKKHGILTISGMTESAHELAPEGKLFLIPEPKQLTQEEKAAIFQQKEFIRIQKEQIENSVPFADRRAAAEKAAKEKVKATQQQATAKGKRDSLISDFSVSAGPGRIDEAASKYFQAQLRGILAHRDGVTDWIGTLALVEEALKGMSIRGDENLRREHARLVRAQAEAKIKK